jgi:tryptophan synthase alpha chain
MHATEQTNATPSPPRDALRARLGVVPGKPLLTCYFPVGDPQLSPELLTIYADAGVDIVELGLPSGNPYLDGPDVARSMVRARGGDWRKSLDTVRDRLARLGPRPAGLIMTYADLAEPLTTSPRAWDEIGAVLVVAPPQDAARRTLETAARIHNVLVSCFVTIPFVSEDILAARTADGYVMLQATPGLTGPRKTLDPESRDRIATLRREGVTAPILLGFGISSGQQAAAAREFGADGVVVGSHCLRAALEGPAALEATLTDLRRGLDG